MADNSTPNSDLKTLVRGTDKRILIKDRYGKEHVLQPLDLGDVVDFEERSGHSLLDAFVKFRVKDLAFLLYLSLRKEGCSEADIEAKKYKYNESQIMRMFDVAFFQDQAVFFLQLLEVSGFEVRGRDKVEKPEGAANPTNESTPAK